MTPVPTLGTRLRRGARKRCAVCGGDDLFEGWFKLRERCPTCGVRFEREEGFFVSALFVNFAITEVVLFAFIAVSFFATLPDPPIGKLIAIAVVLSIVVPIAFYPWGKTLWFAIHL